MSLNDIKLTPELIVELYPSSLVDNTPTIGQIHAGNTTASEIETTSPIVTNSGPSTIPEENNEEGKWKSLGNNRKNILILVRSTDAVFLPDKQLDFLTSMLSACKLSMDDVAIININKYPDSSYKELLPVFKSKIVLLFDIDPASIGLPLNFPHFQLQPFANTTFLYSPSMDDLENDRLLKSKLWVSFKRLFNL